MTPKPTSKRPLHPRKRVRRLACSAAALLLACTGASAETFRLTPRDLGSGLSFSGSITTDGTQGVLDGSHITGWAITVTQVSDIVYNPANTRDTSFGVHVVGDRLVVPTSPDGVSDGGSLSFAANHRFGVRVADFSGAFADGGVAFYVSGAAFDYLPLGQPNGLDYVAARLVPGSSTQYALTPLAFAGDVVLGGTVTTDGLSGAARLTDWDLRVRETTRWRFDALNSTVLSDLNLASDGRQLTVAAFDDLGQPGSFSIGRQGRYDTTAVLLADFQQDPTGEAAFISPLLFQSVAGLPLDAKGRVVVASAVPEPAPGLLLAAGLGALGALRARRGRLAAGGVASLRRSCRPSAR